MQSSRSSNTLDAKANPLTTTSGIISKLDKKPASGGNCEERSIDCIYQVLSCAQSGASVISSDSCAVKTVCFPVNLTGGIVGTVLGCLSSPFAFFCGRSLGIRKEREKFICTAGVPADAPPAQQRM